MSDLSIDSKTLFYQYMINHNSTSTMLNAVLGNNSDDGDMTSLLSGLSGMQTTNYATNALSSLLGSEGQSTEDAGLSSVTGTSSFLNVLQAYMGNMQQTNSDMAQKLSGVLEEAQKTEDTSTLTYKTVQELYDYFKTQSTMTASKIK